MTEIIVDPDLGNEGFTIGQIVRIHADGCDDDEPPRTCKVVRLIDKKSLVLVEVAPFDAEER